MPDLGEYCVGSLRDFSYIHRASPIQHLGRAEPEYKMNTSHKGSDHLDCKTNDF